ncbi:MAG: PTS sugar transporter subunit IIA [Acidobacteriota bacterium]
MPLASQLRTEHVFADIVAADGESALRFFAERMCSSIGIDSDALLEALEERESLGSTGIGGAVAIPHCRVETLKEAVLAVGICRDGVPYGAADGKPVKLFFLIVSPKSDPQQNLKLLSAISRWVREAGNVDRVLALDTRDAIYAALADLPGC